MERKRKKKGNWYLWAGLLMTGLAVFLGILGMFWTPYSTTAMSAAEKFVAPSAGHLFGTDNFGRDILSRVLYGGRYSLLAGMLTVLLAGIFGSIYGAIAGYVGGVLDNVMMRISEMIQAFPTIILAIVISAALGSSMFNTVLAMIIVGWPNYARLMRSVVLFVKENEYVEAARALGTGKARVLFSEIIPNSMTSVIVMATTDIGNQILLFATLSFLGLGNPPPTPEWGMMVSDGVSYFNKFWVAGFPGLAIFTMAVGANFVGDGLRDLMDPKLRKNF